MSFTFSFKFNLVFHLALLPFFVTFGSCFNPKIFNISKAQSDHHAWSIAEGTWYGSPIGGGSDGGACGYSNAVDEAPFSYFITASSELLFDGGKGCGACYQVKCTDNAACSGNPVTVVVTDECPGCSLKWGGVHFDLSGTAFGAMAISGQEDQLRNAGDLQIQYMRVACNYPGVSVAFHVDSGSNPYYFATLIEYEDGDGELSGVDLKQALDSDSWIPLQQSHGAVWKLDNHGQLQAPFSVKLTSGNGRTLVADHVIPAGWQPGTTYRSIVNFN